MAMRTSRRTGIGIAAFKARMGRYLRAVRAGHPIVLLDREAPVARVVPYPPSGPRLAIRGPTRAPRDVRLPPPLPRRVDSLAALRADRESGHERLS